MMINPALVDGIYFLYYIFPKIIAVEMFQVFVSSIYLD